MPMTIFRGFPERIAGLRNFWTVPTKHAQDFVDWKSLADKGVRAKGLKVFQSEQFRKPVATMLLF
jgi:hypothetical protein